MYRAALALFCVLLGPILSRLVKVLAIVPEFIADGGLDGIVGVGLQHKRLDKAQNSHYLVRRLPLVGAEKTQAHGPFVVVGDIGVVYLRLEADDRGLERVFVGERDLDLEDTALHPVSCAVTD